MPHLFQIHHVVIIFFITTATVATIGVLNWHMLLLGIASAGYCLLLLLLAQSFSSWRPLPASASGSAPLLQLAAKPTASC
jgi:cytochrome c biogenesis factor